MFQNYIATKKDLGAIEQALSFAIDPKMKFVFSDFSRIVKTSVVSYDCKYIYAWRLNPTRLASKIQHNLTIPDEWQRGWWAGLISKEIKKYLPKNKREQLISGGLLTPFIELQKAKKVSLNPYTTKESYLATIIHELGHIYFGGYGKKGELSATCAEYYASQLFWPIHAKNLDKFIEKIDKNMPIEAKENDQHTFALLNAKKMIARYPKSWPKKLLS